MADVKINGNNIGAGTPGSHVGDQNGIAKEHSGDKPDSSEHTAATGNEKNSHAAGNRTDKQFARQSELSDQGRQTRAKIEAQVGRDAAKHDVPASLTRNVRESRDSNGNRAARESGTRASERQPEQPRSREDSTKSARTQNSPLDQFDNRSAASRAGQHERNGNDASHIVDYLRGAKDGHNLAPDMRRALDGAARATGRNDVAAFVERHGQNAVEFIERTLHQSDNVHGFATSHEGRATDASVRRTVDELTSIVGLGKQFKEMEKTGGDIGRRAEDSAMRLLFHDGGGHSSRGVSATELMRDLRTGAFLPAREIDNPFPLTGRARVAGEAMELMRTLDAIENALRQFEASRNPATQGGLEAGALHTATGQISTGDPELDALLTLIAKNASGEEIPVGLPLSVTALPGRASQFEMARFINGLNGALTDANGGNLLRAADGSPLKLGELLWLGVAGNLLASSFKADNFPTQLSPLLMHGFDALYSVIGFDGRTLAPPRFVAVEVQVNASELEWVYGQPPLSEGWMRSMIERLKDSVAPDHNVLGETLEEALAGGRFDAVLIQGAVEAGTPVSESFKVAAHTPAKTVEPPFAAHLAYS